MIRGFLLRVGMVLGWILGCVNFMTDGSEDWRVRCGWMYYTEKRPEYRLKRLKIPPYISVKKSAIFYVRRILVHAGNNDYFPGYISRLDTFRKVSSQDTTPAIPPYPQQYYRFTIIPLVIS